MEPLGAFPEGEWDCFRKMFASEEHDYNTPQFLDDGLNIGVQQSTFCSAPQSGGGETEHVLYSLDAQNSNLQYNSQESSYSSNCSYPGHINYPFSYPDHVLANNNCVSMDFCMDEKNISSSSFVASLSNIAMEEENVNFNEDVGSEMEPIVFPTLHQFQLKRKINTPEVMVPAEEEINNRSGNQKKKPRVDVEKCMKNARPKKNQKLAKNGHEGEEANAESNGQSSSCNISEEDNASQENSGGDISGSQSALNSNGKTRASRGSATDPQSLYARKRRERINERLRILQNLVPNGTKVDISTMLEEAVNYVKFLQLQIKLLSSDDLWMYAPIAYNGLGLNFNLKNSSLL